MKDTDIFFSIALMILGIVLMYKSMKGNSCRQILAKLADSIASDKEDINFQTSNPQLSSSASFLRLNVLSSLN